jgi:L,D-transpeptidase ErfK/SrfK
VQFRGTDAEVEGKMKRKIGIFSSCSAFRRPWPLLTAAWILLVACVETHATFYQLHDNNDSVIGEIKITTSVHEDTLPDIARVNGLGYQEIKLVNPGMDTWIPGAGSRVVLPVQFVLPQGSRKGIILNIPEMRLYYFPEPGADGESEVITYPLGVGREGWNTPYTSTSITSKTRNPSWYPPESIRNEHRQSGELLPKVVKPGPDNPLGDYAMKLGIPSYLIHGTNKPYGVGMRVSHGCIRLYPEDIKELFTRAKLGTAVAIINQPYKVGAKNGRIYLEAHPFLQEDAGKFAGNLTSVVKMVVNITSERLYTINWDLAKQVINERKGIPVVIGSFLSSQQDLRTATAGKEKTDLYPNGLMLRLDSDLPGNLEQEMF